MSCRITLSADPKEITRQKGRSYITDITSYVANRPSRAIPIGVNGLETNFGVTFKLDVIPSLPSSQLHCPKKSQGFSLEGRVLGSTSGPDLNDSTIRVPSDNSKSRARTRNRAAMALEIITTQVTQFC